MISATISSSGAIASRSACAFTSSHCSAASHLAGPDVASGPVSGACTDAAPDAAGSDAAGPPPATVSAAETAADPARDMGDGPSSAARVPPAPWDGSDLAGAAADLDARLLARGLNGLPRELVAWTFAGRLASASAPFSSSVLMWVSFTGEPWWDGRPRFRVLRRCCIVNRSGRSSDSMPLASAHRRCDLGPRTQGINPCNHVFVESGTRAPVARSSALLQSKDCSGGCAHAAAAPACPSRPGAVAPSSASPPASVAVAAAAAPFSPRGSTPPARPSSSEAAGPAASGQHAGTAGASGCTAAAAPAGMAVPGTVGGTGDLRRVGRTGSFATACFRNSARYGWTACSTTRAHPRSQKPALHRQHAI